jgi:hypothetical protein
MVRQIYWPAAIKGEDLFIQNGLHFMRNNFYPKV